MNLLEKLDAVASAWVAAWQKTFPDASLKTLGVRCLNNSKLFERSDMLTGTYERVLSYLADPVNWPECCIPPDPAVILAEMGHPIPDAFRFPHTRLAVA